MNYIYIGEIVNTHGLKGEVKIISDFKFKTSVFKEGMTFYIGNSKKKEVVKSYRKHKNYDMVSFIDSKHIEDVISYKGEAVYVNRQMLVYTGYLNEDLIGLTAYSNDKKIGMVDSIVKTNAHEILVIKNKKKFMVPNIDEFVLKVDLNKKRIDIKYLEGLFDEN